MCLLIVQKQKNKVTKKQFKNAWERNNDGVGYSFVKNGKIVTKKYLDDDGFKKFLKSINSDVNRHGDESPFLIHFRYTTHGATNLKNCHPFRVSDDLVFGHNGCINGVDDDFEKSDTAVFNDDIVKNLPSDWLNNPSIVKLVEGFIGHSKLAFLHKDKSFDILNENLGHWTNKGGIWFSNDGYKKPTYKKVKTQWSTGYGWNTIDSGYSRTTRIEDKKDDKKIKAEDKFLTCEWCQSDGQEELTEYDIGVEGKEPKICGVCLDAMDKAKDDSEGIIHLH